MSGNRLLTAIVVMVGLLALTVWQFNKRDAEDAKPADVVAKLPKVKKDDVTELSIAPPGKTAVTLKKVDGAWKMTAPLTADADKDAVDTALSKLDELESVAVAATKADNHEQLEVTEAKGVHVVAKQGDKVLADVLIGAYRSGNTMVREKDQAIVATAKGSMKFAFDKEMKEWRDRVIVEVSADALKAATFTNKNGTWKFVKDGADWKQAPGEKEIPKFDASKVSGIVGTAIGLRANDFAAEGVTAETAGVGPNAAGSLTLTTGGDAGESQILVRIGNKSEGGYYTVREGKDPIFVVSEYAGERLMPALEKFQKEEPKAAEAPTVVQPTGRRIVGGGGPGLAEAMKNKNPHAPHPPGH